MVLEVFLLPLLLNFAPVVEIDNNLFDLSQNYLPFYIDFIKLEISKKDIPDDNTVENDKWFAEDKFWHWAVSVVLVGASYHFLSNRIGQPEPDATITSLSLTLSFGIFKEVWDYMKYNHFSYKDLIYDILGIGTGYLLFIY